MKAVLDQHQSKIIAWGPKGIDVGPLPKGVGIDRLRWTGSELVDLLYLTEIYVVEEAIGVFSFHAREIPGSQLVTMQYTDRKDLINDNGTIRVKTVQERLDEQTAKLIQRAKSKATSAMGKQMGMVVEQFMFTQRLMYVLIWSLRTGNAQGLQFVDNYLTEMGTLFDLADPNFKADLIADYKKIKAVIKDYYQDLEDVSSMSSSESSRSSESSSSSSSSSMGD